MSNRVFNFNPGPSTLPLDVLKIIQEELLDYRGTGMSAFVARFKVCSLSRNAR